MLRLSRADAWFGPAGRIAASNYIGQSLITAILFTGLGFGLAEKVPVWGTLVIALAIYVTQLAVSAWWTRRHRYGPVEWLLRTVTYGVRRPSSAGTAGTDRPGGGGRESASAQPR